MQPPNSPPPRGRGLNLNPTGRFEARHVEAFDDGWPEIEEEPAAWPTTVTPERTRDPFARNDSPDIPFSKSINPYRGCEHGCAYCFARPSHAYMGLSPGLDFETKLFSKPDLPQRLRETLSKPRYEPEVVALGANTDIYQPVERDLEITRQVLQVMAEFRHPVELITKSRLVLRDLDVLKELASRDLVRVMVSITTLDSDLARRLEPRAAGPLSRVEVLKRLTAAGVPTGVLVSPVIPGLTDSEVERILEVAAEAGADVAGTILLRLPREMQTLFESWLDDHEPRRKDKVLGLLREAHGGEVYRSNFGTRMRGEGPWADMLARRFQLQCDRLGLNQERLKLSLEHFRRPPREGQNLELFGGE